MAVAKLADEIAGEGFEGNPLRIEQARRWLGAISKAFPPLEHGGGNLRWITDRHDAARDALGHKIGGACIRSHDCGKPARERFRDCPRKSIFERWQDEDVGAPKALGQLGMGKAGRPFDREIRIPPQHRLDVVFDHLGQQEPRQGLTLADEPKCLEQIRRPLAQ